MCFKSILEDCIETIPREYHRTRECADLEGTHRENIKSNCWTCAGHPNPTVHPLAITINSSYLPLQLLCSSTPVILLFLVKAMDESHLKVKVLILMASKLPFVCFFFLTIGIILLSSLLREKVYEMCISTNIFIFSEAESLMN